MLLPSYLRRSRHGIYYFRLVLPVHLAAHFGQRELVRSLGVRCPKIARFSGYQIAQRIKPLMERITALMAIDPNSFTPKDIKKLVLQGLDFRPDGSMGVERVETHPDPAIAEREMQVVRKTATDWQQVHRDNHLTGLTDEQIAARKSLMEREKAVLVAEMQAATQTAIAAATAQRPERPDTLIGGYNAYISKKKIRESTLKAYKGSFDVFAALMGGEQRMIHEIKLSEIQRFNEALALVPLHASKRGIALKPAAELIKNPITQTNEDGDEEEVECISANTANLHLTNLQTMFGSFMKGGRMPEGARNPIEGLERHSDGNQEIGADAFEEDELRRIFDPEMIMQAKRPTQFWGPLLALYTGARLNDLACLDMADFVTEKGIPCISIRFVPRAKPGTIQHKNPRRSAKQTKTPVSRRHVPLHPDLWEIGLQDYIDDMKNIGATRLFPTLPSDTKGKRERRMSHDGNEYLKKVEVHIPRIKVMHSFRDTVSDMLGLSDMDEFTADQWTGHATQGVKAKHYRRKVAIDIMAVKGFKALDFPFIDTNRIQYRKGWWNEWTVPRMKD
jgi:integrase